MTTIKNDTFKSDIIILGGGLSGLLMACLLQKYNFNITLIEKNPWDKLFTSTKRTITLNHGSFTLLADIVPEIKLLSYGKVEQIHVLDQSDDISLCFKADDIGLQASGYVLYNHDLIKTLHSHLGKQEDCTLIDNTEGEFEKLSKTHIKALLKNTIIDAKFLLISDGKDSETAKKFGFKKVAHDYNQHILLCEVKHTMPHNNAAIEKFMPIGPVALLPLQNQNQSTLLWTVPSSSVERFISKPKEELEDFISHYTPVNYGAIEVLSPLQTHPLSAHYCYPNYNENIFLIGNSLHGLHPLAGQGFNLIIRDLKQIAAFLKQVKEDNYNIETSGLYVPRLADQATLMTAIHGISLIFGNRSPASHFMRKMGMKIIKNIPFLQKNIMRHAAGLD